PKPLGPSTFVHSLAMEAQGHWKRWTITSLLPGLAGLATARSPSRGVAATSRAAVRTAAVARAVVGKENPGRVRMHGTSSLQVLAEVAGKLSPCCRVVKRTVSILSVSFMVDYPCLLAAEASRPGSCES